MRISKIAQRVSYRIRMKYCKKISAEILSIIAVITDEYKKVNNIQDTKK